MAEEYEREAVRAYRKRNGAWFSCGRRVTLANAYVSMETGRRGNQYLRVRCRHCWLLSAAVSMRRKRDAEKIARRLR